MSLSLQSLANEFREKYELTNSLTRSTLSLQSELVVEESIEVEDAFVDLDLGITNRRAKEHLLKELADLTYVCFQAAAAFGWDLEEAFRRVHESNLSKLGEDGKPIRNELGKILKGPNYTEPSLIDLV